MGFKLKRLFKKVKAIPKKVESWGKRVVERKLYQVPLAIGGAVGLGAVAGPSILSIFSKLFGGSTPLPASGGDLTSRDFASGTGPMPEEALGIFERIVKSPIGTPGAAAAASVGETFWEKLLNIAQKRLLQTSETATPYNPFSWFPGTPDMPRPAPYYDYSKPVPYSKAVPSRAPSSAAAPYYYNYFR